MNQNNAVAEALERLDALATPGPWRTTRLDQGIQIWSSKNSYVGETRDYGGDDADLIVALRNNLPTIIAALKAQRVDGGGVS